MTLEAERFGFDVNETNVSKDTHSLSSKSNTAMASTTSNSTSKGMLFSFFNDDANNFQNNSDDENDNDEEDNENDSITSNDDDDDDSDNLGSGSDNDYEHDDNNKGEGEENIEKSKNSSKINKEKKTNTYPTFDEVLKLAKEFKRDM